MVVMDGAGRRTSCGRRRFGRGWPGGPGARRCGQRSATGLRGPPTTRREAAVAGTAGGSGRAVSKGRAVRWVAGAGPVAGPGPPAAGARGRSSRADGTWSGKPRRSSPWPIPARPVSSPGCGTWSGVPDRAPSWSTAASRAPARRTHGVRPAAGPYRPSSSRTPSSPWHRLWSPSGVARAVFRTARWAQSASSRSASASGLSRTASAIPGRPRHQEPSRERTAVAVRRAARPARWCGPSGGSAVASA